MRLILLLGMALFIAALVVANAVLSALCMLGAMACGAHVYISTEPAQPRSWRHYK